MRTRLTYSNVVATLALFVALGGSSYAAIKITGKQIKDGSVTTADVKNRSLLAKDFKAGQLKAGPRGLTGPAGPTGAAGAAGKDGAPGAEGSAKAYAYITSQGAVAPGSKGITSANVTAKAFGEYCITGLAFTPRVAIVQPDILSNDMNDDVTAEVQTPNDGTGSCPGSDQVYVRTVQMTVSGGNISRVGQSHGFYIEIN